MGNGWMMILFLGRRDRNLPPPGTQAAGRGGQGSWPWSCKAMPHLPLSRYLSTVR